MTIDADTASPASAESAAEQEPGMSCSGATTAKVDTVVESFGDLGMADSNALAAPHGASEEGEEAESAAESGDCAEESIGLSELVQVRIKELDERFLLGDVLGEGRFSQVRCAVRVNGGSARGGGGGAGGAAGGGDVDDEDDSECVDEGDFEVVALKGMKLSDVYEDEEALEMLQAEVAALRLAAAHEHLASRVVKLHEVLSTKDMLYLVMDRVNGQELFQVVEERGAVAEPLARRLMFELISALAAMHAIGIVHRDIKPENLIVCGMHKPETARLVVIDFGYAALVGSKPAEGLAGSPEYAAPEVLSWLEAEIRPSEVSGIPYGGKCDVWSAGVTAHVLLCADLHFTLPEAADDDEPDEMELVEAARDTELKFEQPEWQSATMSAAKAFVRACMTVDPEQRISAADALALEWFANADATATVEEAEELAATEVAAEAAAEATATAAMAALTSADLELTNDETAMAAEEDATGGARLSAVEPYGEGGRAAADAHAAAAVHGAGVDVSGGDGDGVGVGAGSNDGISDHVGAGGDGGAAAVLANVSSDEVGAFDATENTDGSGDGDGTNQTGAHATAATAAATATATGAPPAAAPTAAAAAAATAAAAVAATTAAASAASETGS